MNLSLLSTQGIIRKEVLVSDLGLNGFVTDLRAGRPNGLPACLPFELMEPVGSLRLSSGLNFPHPLTAQGVADPDDYSRWRMTQRGGRLGLNSVSVPIDGFPSQSLHRLPLRGVA